MKNLDLLNSLDWSRTSIGPRKTWPPEMESMVTSALASAFPICLGFGPDFVLIYNDAYNRLFGVKHPQSFGATAAEAWPEIWDFLAPALDEVVRTRTPLWMEDFLLPLSLSGIPEEMYFDFSYSPLFGQGGNVMGVMSVANAKTEEVVSRRRSATHAALAPRLEKGGAPASIFEQMREALDANRMDAAQAALVRLADGALGPIWSLRTELQLTAEDATTVESLANDNRLARVQLSRGLDGDAGETFVVPLLGQDGKVGLVLLVSPDRLVRTGPQYEEFLHSIGSHVQSELIRQEAHRAALASVRSEVEEREERLRLLETAIAMLNDIVIITEARGLDAPDGPRIVYANPALERIMGYSPEFAIGKTPRFLQGEDTQRTELDRIRSALEEVRPILVELVNYKASGEPVHLEISIAPIMDKAGRVTHFVAVERDVSERREAEAKIRESENRFQRITRATHDVIWELDLETNLLWWSENAESVFGFRPDTFEDWMSRVHPDDRERLEIRHDGVLTRGEELISDKYRIRVDDGEYRQVHDIASIVHDDDGHPVRMVGTMRDTTEMQQIQDRLQQKQKLEAVGRLTGGMAHDINNFLTIILGNADLLEEEADGTGLESIRSIIRAAERGAELTSRLLTFARGQTLKSEAVDMNELVRDLGKIIRQAIQEDITLKLDLAPDLEATLIDPGQMEVALLNLVFNARDAMTPGGTLTIATSNRRLSETVQMDDGDLPPGNFVELRVTDTGVGMPPHVLQRVFDPFFTTKKPGEGTGLGLSMVYGFVRQSGGTVKAESRSGEGTSVCMLLPAAPAHPPRKREGSGRRELSGHGERVLVVEDEAGVRDYTCRALETLGYDVTVSAGVAEALAMIESDAPLDLLVTDIKMPGEFNGVELARRAQAARPRMPVLFISGYAKETLSQAEEIGADAPLLTKPFRRTELARAVRQALER